MSSPADPAPPKMSRRWLLAAPLLLPTGCFPRTWSVRYRVTMAIDTPHGVSSASGVWEDICHDKIWLPGGDNYNWTRRGDPIAIGLPDAKLVLLRTLSASWTMAKAAGLGKLAPQVKPDDVKLWPQNAPDVIRLFRRTRVRVTLLPSDLVDLPRHYFREPLAHNLVRIDAGADPASLRVVENPMRLDYVDPTNLAAKLGRGIHFGRLAIEVTTDPVT